MNRSTPGLPAHHQLPELTQTHVHRVSDAIQPSHPLLSPSPPAPNPSQHQSLPKHKILSKVSFFLSNLVFYTYNNLSLLSYLEITSIRTKLFSFSLIKCIFISYIFFLWSRSVVSDSLQPQGCSLPGSSVHGIFQARVLERVAISFSRGSSQPRDWTQVFHIAGRCFTLWATREAPLLLTCIQRSFSY